MMAPQSSARRNVCRPQASTTRKSHPRSGAFRSRWVHWLAGTVMFMLFGATLVYWIASLRETLTTSCALPTIAVVPPQENQAKLLFGGELIPSPERTIRLAGVLSLREGAAAIVSVGYAPAHVVSLGSNIMPGSRLFAVSAHSIMVERNRTQFEVMLTKMPALQPGALPTIHVR